MVSYNRHDRVTLHEKGQTMPKQEERTLEGTVLWANACYQEFKEEEGAAILSNFEKLLAEKRIDTTEIADLVKIVEEFARLAQINGMCNGIKDAHRHLRG